MNPWSVKEGFPLTGHGPVRHCLKSASFYRARINVTECQPPPWLRSKVDWDHPAATYIYTRPGLAGSEPVREE